MRLHFRQNTYGLFGLIWISCIGACTSPAVDDARSSAGNLSDVTTPQAIIVEPLNFPQDEDVRQLAPEPGLSNASCGLNAERGIQVDILARVNSLRAEARYCGTQIYEAARPLTWNIKLQNAAYHHSVEMARANLISHVSIDSRELWNRVRQSGYAFSRVAENIAAGQTNVEAAMVSWQKSPAHCAALMDPKVEEIGVACIFKQSSFYRYYWTMDLAKPFVAPPPQPKQEVEKQDKTKSHNPFLKVAEDIKKF